MFQMKLQNITGGIISIIESRGIDFSKVVWLASDGASNMSGHIPGVQAQMKNEKCEEATCLLSKPPIAACLCSIIKKFKPLK